MANDFKRGIRIYLETSDYGKGINEMIYATQKYEKSLEELTAESKKMTDAGIKSGKAYDDLQKQIKQTEKALGKAKTAEEDYRTKLKQTEKVLNNLSGTTYNELLQVQKQLQKELKDTTRGTDLHKTKLEQLNRVNKEVSKAQGELNSNLGKNGSFFGRAADGINKYMGMAAGAIMAITGLTMGIKKFMDMRRELEDSQANLKALTGLNDSDITWLTEQAKQMSTATDEMGISITATSKEIMDGYTVIGSKRPELLKNKEAMAEVTKQALTLAAAGKMEVATAFDVVTAAMNQFNLGADQSNRIINTIAAGSLEGSAEADNLAGSLKNVGTVADDSNMTLEQTVATLEVLASKQLMGEEAGTKLRGAILKMKDAGMGYASGSFNFRDALIEINANLEKQGSALERDALLQKVFGAENITAGTILLGNVEAYDKLTVAVTGTNVAMTQAQINTQTTSAKLAQAKNRFNELGMEFVQNLNPAVLSATNMTNKFLKILIAMPEFFKNYAWTIAGLTITLTAYTIAVNASVIADKLKVFWTDKVVVSFNKLTAAVRANPWALIATGFILAITWLNNYLNKQKEVNTEQQKFNDLVEKSKDLQTGNKSLEDRVKIMQSLSKSQLETLKSDLETQLAEIDKFDAEIKTRSQKALDEDKLLQELKIKAGKETNAALKANLAHQVELRENAILEELGAEFGKNLESKKMTQQYIKDIELLLKKKPNTTTPTTSDKPAKTDPYTEALNKRENDYKEFQLNIRELRANEQISEEVFNEAMLNAQLSFLTDKRALQVKYKKETVDTDLEILDTREKMQKQSDDVILKAIKDQYDAGLKVITQGEETKSNLLQEALSRGEITEKEYNLEMKKLAKEAAEAKVALALSTLEALKAAEFESDEARELALKNQQDEIDKLKKLLHDAGIAFETELRGQKEKYDDIMSRIFQGSFSQIGDLFSAFNKLTDKELTKNLDSWTDWGIAIAGAVSSALQVAQQFSDQYFEYKAAALDADKQRELTNAGDNAEQRQKIEQKYAQKELDLKKKKSSADTVLKVAQALSSGALAVMQAYANLDPISATVAAVLLGGLTALEVATIVKQNAAIQNTTLDSSVSGSSTISTGTRIAQAADGRWDVIGADDGRTYRNVPYRGVARTGIITTPTLMGEVGDELIVDNPTLRNIRMDAPWVLDTIRQLRVPQRAGGNYSNLPAGNSSPQAGMGATSDGILAMNIQVMERLLIVIQWMIDNGIDANIYLDKLEKKIELKNKSISKGSAK